MIEKYAKLDRTLDKTIIVNLYIFAAAMPFSIALTQISLGLALLAWIGRLLVTRGAQVRRLSIEWAFLAYIAAEVLSLIFSTNFSQSFIYLKRLLLIPIVYLVAFNIRDSKHLKNILVVFLVSLTLYSLTGIYSFFQHPMLRVRHVHNSMTAGGITMIASVLAFAAFSLGKEVKQKLLLSGVLIINLICLLLTNTRGSWLGFLFAMLFIIFYTNRKMLIAVPFVVVLFYFLSPAAFSYRLQHFFDPRMSTNAKRLVWWQTGWEIFKDHPIVGIGDVSTTEMFKKYAPPYIKEYIGHMHSNYVHIAVTLGTVGFIAFMYMIIWLFIRLYQLMYLFRPRGDLFYLISLAALAVYLAFNINGFFEWNFGDAEIITMIWFMMGMSFAALQLQNEKR